MILAVYILSFGPTIMLLAHNSKWSPMPYNTHYRVYAPVYWLMARSEASFKIITGYCTFCEKVMKQEPPCPWSWHYMRAQEGLEK